MTRRDKQLASPLGKNLLGIYLASLVFLVGTLLIVQVSHEYQNFDRNILRTGNLIIDTLKASVVDPVVKTLAYDRLHDILNNVYTKNEDIQSIRVYETPDHLIATVGTRLFEEDNIPNNLEILLKAHKHKLIQRHKHEYIFWSLLKVNNEIIGTLRMSIGSAYFRQHLQRSILFFLGLALFLATISSWLFTEYLERRIIIPLSRTSEIMGNFQHTDLHNYLTNIDTIRNKLPDNEIKHIATSYKKVVEMVQRHTQTMERIVTAIEQTSESIVITDSGGRIQYVNPAFETHSGYSASEAIGTNPRVLQSGQHNESFYRDMWRTLSSGKKWTGKFTNRKKDGSLYLEDSSISPITDKNGKITNYVAVKRDITKESRLEQQLCQAQRMESIGRMAGGIAHDFNNILTVVNGHTQLSLLMIPQDDPLRENILTIQEAGAKATKLVKQLQSFSRNQIICQEILHLDDEIKKNKTMLSHLLDEDITVILNFDDTPWPVIADRGQFEQIITNLAVNSRDAMPDGGTLTIESFNIKLRQENSPEHPHVAIGEYVLLRITDTGEGMSQETQRLIFEPFFTTKNVGRGTGLGMSTVYGIIKQHNGWINVSSEIGKGTTINLYFPRCVKQTNKHQNDQNHREYRSA